MHGGKNNTDQGLTVWKVAWQKESSGKSHRDYGVIGAPLKCGKAKRVGVVTDEEEKTHRDLMPFEYK